MNTETQAPKPTIPLKFTLNGKPVETLITPGQFLLDVVRLQFGLTAAKHGCDIGICGACTLIVNGKAVKACIYAAEKAQGAEVWTLEGLSDEQYLDPLQDAWLRHGASQCGYSTPGMIMAAKALLLKNPDPTREDIIKALSGNLCRCTGYQQIVDAVLEAAEMIRKGIQKVPLKEETSSAVIGKGAYSKDTLDKVTGHCKFTDDVDWKDALWAQVARSTQPHALLGEIDTSKAKEYPGVVAVFTHADIPGSKRYGKAIRDQSVLAFRKVRHIGEPVALIVAETREAAAEAAKLVRIEYTPLPHVFDCEEALRPEAPVIHDEPEAIQDFVHEQWLNPRQTGTFPPNVLYYFPIRKGNIEEGFAQSDLIVERTYRTPWIEHACMEYEAAIAIPDADGGIRVSAPTQNVFLDRREICDVLGIPKEKVRIIQLPMGAAYGKREDMFGQLQVSLAAWLLKKPVKMVYTREETFAWTTKRYPMAMKYKTGVTKEGKILAFEATLLVEKGAYASWGPSGLRKSVVHAAGPYEIPNIKVDGYSIYTNNIPTGPMRGFGATEVAFAHETHIDNIARELGMDPVEFRKKNLIPSGGKTATGQILNVACTPQDTLEAAIKKLEELPPLPPPAQPHIKRGRGLATMMYGIGYGHGIPDIGSAVCELMGDGTLMVKTSAVDYGQGLLTAFSQIAAQTAGVPFNHVQIITGDTQETPDSGSSVATRQTHVSGNAVRIAAEKLKIAILEQAGKIVGLPAEELSIKDGYISKGERNLLTLRELAKKLASEGIFLKKQGRFKAKTTALDISCGQGDAYWPYAFGTQIVELDVDTQTGKVALQRIIAAHNVGKVLNPNNVLGQIYGGISQGIGMALMEEFKFEEGKPASLNFDTYRIPRTLHMPPMEAVIMEIPEVTGPYGAIGIGEPSTVPTAPAIINAIAQATGKEFNSLPVTKETILKAISE
jgi:CO/xanthine dehydrogenase Mo-binding subunit/aerobic-type carbon monoxide dehydrogenase small subunit (CoxS/CutS family)